MTLRVCLVTACAHVLACVHVPDDIRAEFAPPGPQDRTNYRPQTHGSVPPHRAPTAATEASMEKTASTRTGEASVDEDGEVAADPEVAADGGIPASIDGDERPPAGLDANGGTS